MANSLITRLGNNFSPNRPRLETTSMARFFVAAVLLTALACSSLASPLNPTDNNKEVIEGSSPITSFSSESGSGDVKFFFPFNFWNFFRPGPWIPLPGLITTTAKPNESGNDNDKDEDDDEDQDEDDDDDPEEEDDDDDQEDEDDDDAKEDEDEDDD